MCVCVYLCSIYSLLFLSRARSRLQRAGSSLLMQYLYNDKLMLPVSLSRKPVLSVCVCVHVRDSYEMSFSDFSEIFISLIIYSLV